MSEDKLNNLKAEQYKLKEILNSTAPPEKKKYAEEELEKCEAKIAELEPKPKKKSSKKESADAESEEAPEATEE